MKKNAGLWIDHREAIIVMLSETGDETKHILSGAEKHLRRMSEPSEGPFKAHEAPADDSKERLFSGDLSRYYDQVVSCLRDAGSIMILGPGEAKGELMKRFEKRKDDTRSIIMATADRMTEPQVVAHIRQHFHP